MGDDENVKGLGGDMGGAGTPGAPPPDELMSIEFVEHQDIPIASVDVEDEAESRRVAALPRGTPAPVPSGADEKIQDLEDKLLRLRAEFENYRKRVERDREEQKKAAAKGLIRDLLPAMDNLDRALQHQPAGCDENWTKGIALVLQQFFDATAKAGLEKIEAAGAPFDPALHEAIATVCDEAQPHNQVIDVAQNGYMLGGKLLKPARVRVNFLRESNGGPDA